MIQIGFSFSTSGFIFILWLYFPVDFGHVLIIIPFFHSSFPFIFTAAFFYGISVLSFISSLLLSGFCNSSTFQDFIYLIWRNFYFFIPWTSKLFVYIYQVIWMHSIKCTSISDQCTLIFLTQYFSRIMPSLAVWFSIIETVTSLKSFICISPYIRS